MLVSFSSASPASAPSALSAVVPHQGEEAQEAFGVDAMPAPGEGDLAGEAAGRLDEAGGNLVQLFLRDLYNCRAIHLPTPFRHIIGASIARFPADANFY